MKVRIVGGFLGAGKTSAIRSLARYLSERGERVAVITNDQGKSLVDTELLTPAAEWVKEIGGGCFCCKYEKLEEALRSAASAGATVAIAEAVGSCTDLVATVVSPLAERVPGLLSVEPLAIVVDPFRVREVGAGAFGEDVRYLFCKQIEEADVVVISRADIALPASLADVRATLQEIAPHAAFVHVSNSSEQGLGEWISARPVRPAAPLVLDYDRYAAAEASLGWLNANVHITCDDASSPADVVQALLDRVHGLPIAHLKLAVFGEADRAVSVGSAAIVRKDGVARLDLQALPPRTCDLRLRINARISLAASELQTRLSLAMTEAAASMAPGAAVDWKELECFEPARPVPVHRYTYRCGTDDDGSCCAAFYDRPEVRYLLGESLHPGGVALTLALAKSLSMLPGERMLDVACGNGASLRAILEHYAVSAVGLDTGDTLRSSERLQAIRGDAHAIPPEVGMVDAVLCECALSTFSDPRKALLEMQRVLRPGRRIVASDMVVEGPIPEALKPYAHNGACLAGARTKLGWRALFEDCGLRIVAETDESAHLRVMLASIKRNLLGAAMAKASGLLPAGVEIDVAKSRGLLREAEATLLAGHVQYASWVLEPTQVTAGAAP
jgi:Ni2+-binding GTPase involved in maturation of urease and hydrogenase/SAM-dependent methyltransferase